MVYKTTLTNEVNQVLFQGKTLDISRSGARIVGLPVGTGPAMNELVVTEFLILPKVYSSIVVSGETLRLE